MLDIHIPSDRESFNSTRPSFTNKRLNFTNVNVAPHDSSVYIHQVDIATTDVAAITVAFIIVVLFESEWYCAMYKCIYAIEKG